MPTTTNATPPEYPVDMEEVLRLTGRMPRRRLRGKDESEKEYELRMRQNQRSAAEKLRKEWGLTTWQDGNRLLYDRDEVARKKAEHLKPKVHQPRA